MKIDKVLRWIKNYIPFFLLTAFVTTCCMILFLKNLEYSLNVKYSEENLRRAAIMTFGNVILLSAIFTVIDWLRRKLMVERPVKRIIGGLEKIMSGDFSARIEPIGGLSGADGFDVIIEYFNKMAEELSGIETLRTDFTANVSHELKTPLAVTQNYGTLLQQPNLPEEKRLEYAKAITESARRQADLITNILKLNKLENQRIFPDNKVYNLGEQLCECLLKFESVWEQKNIEINSDIEEEIFIKADEELLTLVWNNLFSNAFKFTENGGSVSVSLYAENEFAAVKISDTGCGISPETGAHIFEKFYQGDTSHATQGNGLGLALVKRIIDIAGGEISVESEVGKGSVFTVKIRRNVYEVQADTP